MSKVAHHAHHKIADKPKQETRKKGRDAALLILVAAFLTGAAVGCILAGKLAPSIELSNTSCTLARTLGRLSMANGSTDPRLFTDGMVDAARGVFSAGHVFGVCCANSC